MALVLKLKTIEGTTLWNFLDTLGAENPGSCACDLRYLAWDSREPVVSLIESDTRDGGWMGRSRQSLKTSTHGFNLSAATKDGLLTGYNALAAHLANGRGKYFEYQLNAATATEYLDFTHGWPAALLMDEDSAKWVEDRIRAPNLPVTIVHQPFFRLDEIDAALNKLTNAKLLCQGATAGRPNDWTWVSSANISAESISNGWSHRTVSIGSERELNQTVSGAVPGDVWTGSFDAYTDNATNGRVRAAISFYTAADVLIAETEGSLITPSTDPDNPTRVVLTAPAAPATTAKVRLGLQSVNTSAAAIVHSWRNANLSRTTTDPIFRAGEETINNDPASTTAGQRARTFVVDVRSDAPVEARLKLQGNGANYGEPVRVAAVPISHPADFEKWLNGGHFHNLGGATLTNGATAVADGAGSGAGTNTINIPGASATDLTTKFASVTVTPSTYGLRGKFLLVPRLRATVINADWSVKILWGMSTSTPPYDMPILSLPDLSSTFTEEKVGTINLLEDADPFTLKFDIYARRDGGTGDLRLNIFSFIPVHQISTLQGSGALVGATDYVVTDPGSAGPPEKFNSSDQFLDFIQVPNGTQPFVLEPGLNAIYVADEFGNLTGTVKASITYEPTRHA